VKELYLDANAHVPMSPATLKEFCNFHNSKAAWGNPSAPSAPGQAAASALEGARGKIAVLLGTSPQNLIFTSTCTQACEWGIEILKHKSIGGKIQCSAIEHSAVRDPVAKINHISIPTAENGVIGEYEYLPTVCIHVQNEIGTIQPINELNVPFLFSDMCQSVGKETICLRDMSVDIATFGAHKFGGPAGVGILYLKDFNIWQEFGTGSRYFSDRPGTPDVASIVATAKALEETLFNMPERLNNMREFQTTLEDGLEEMRIEIIGKGARRVPNTTFIKLPGIAFNILAELSQKGIYVGMGSACGSLHTGQSLVMKALNQSGDGQDFIRISQHGEYRKADALYLLRELSALIKKYGK